MKPNTPSGQSNNQPSILKSITIFTLLSMMLFLVTLQLIFTGRNTIAQALQHSGNVYTNTENWEEAQWAYQSALRWDAYDHNTYFGLGKSSTYLLQTDKARLAYQNGLNVNPNHILSQIDLARLLIHFGEYTQAEELLNRAYASVPHFWLVHQAQALLAEEQGDLQLAAKEMKQTILLELNPLPMHYIQLGNLQYKIGHYEEAEVSANTVLGKNPNSPSALSLKGRLAALNGMNERALSLFKEALQNYNDSEYAGSEWMAERIDTRIAIAHILMDTHHYRDALEQIILVLDEAFTAISLEKIALRLIDWQHSEAKNLSSLEFWNIGKVAVAGGLHEQALQNFTTALEGDLNKHQDACRLDIARTLRTLDRTKEAVTWLKQIDLPTLASTLELAEVYEDLNKPASARFEYTSVLQLYSVNIDTRADIEERIEILKNTQ